MIYIRALPGNAVSRNTSDNSTAPRTIASSVPLQRAPKTALRNDYQKPGPSLKLINNMSFAAPSGPRSYTSPAPRSISRVGRLVLPLVVVIGFGVGIPTYLNFQQRRQLEMQQEEQRLRRNLQLMDAYGRKESVDDVAKALDTYENRQ